MGGDKSSAQRKVEAGEIGELNTGSEQEYYIKNDSTHSTSSSDLSTGPDSEPPFVENSRLMDQISNLADLMYGRLDGIEKEKQMAIVQGEDRPASDPKAIPKGIARKKMSELEKQYGKETVTQHVNQYVNREINEMSDEVPNSPALDNDFFREWVSEKTMSPEQTHLMLNEYLAITAMTANAVAQTYSVSRNSEQKKRTVMNLAEESGVPLAGEGSDADSKEGDSISEAKPHLELLYEYANGIMSALGVETNYSESNRYDKDMLLPSTKQARDELQGLYTGKSVSLNGTNDTSVKGEHAEYIDAAGAATSLAHESKAPGMLLGVFLSNIKHTKAVQSPSEDQVDENREYFDEHLGTGLVDRSVQLFGNKKYLSKGYDPNNAETSEELRKFSDNFTGQQRAQQEADNETYNLMKAVSSILSGKSPETRSDGVDLNFEGFQKVMLDENQLVKDMSAQERRDRGFVEQAHRKDACSNFVEAVMAYGSNSDRMMAYVEGKNAFNQFLDKVQGRFWDGLNAGVAEVGVDKQIASEATMKRAFSYGDYEKIKSQSPSFSRSDSADSKEGGAVERLENSRGDNHRRSGSLGSEYEGRTAAQSALKRIEERRSQQWSK